jgi:hypothetical protein
VEKGIGMSYSIGKPTNRKGGCTDGKRVPQTTGTDYVKACLGIEVFKDLFK